MPNGRIDIEVPALPGVEPGTVAEAWAGLTGGGGPDYGGAAVNNVPAPLFPDGVGVPGFGAGPFGVSFGHDGGRSPGFGRGVFGYYFGAGVDRAAIAARNLSDGEWTVGVKLSDPAGNQSSATEATATVAAAPDAPASLSADALDVASGRLTVTWS